MATTEQAIIRVVDGQVETGNEFALAIRELERSAGALVRVTDKDSCANALAVVSKGKADIKAITALAEPERIRLQKAKEDLLAQRDRIIGQIEVVISPLEREARDWNNLERQRAEAEERRKNDERMRKAKEEAEAERKRVEAAAAEERKARQAEIEAARKAGEMGKREAERLKKEAVEAEARAKEQAAADAKTQAEVAPIKVKPNTATAPGVSTRQNYKFEVIDSSAVKSPWRCPDEKEIGIKVRGDKDPEKSMREIGGIRAWAE